MEDSFSTAFLLQLGPVQLWIMLTLSMLPAKPTWLHVCSKRFQDSGIYSKEKREAHLTLPGAIRKAGEQSLCLACRSLAGPQCLSRGHQDNPHPAPEVREGA